MSRFLTNLAVSVPVILVLSLTQCSGPIAEPPVPGPVTTTTVAGPAPVPTAPFAASTTWSAPLPDPAPSGPAGDEYGIELQREITQGYGHASINTAAYAPAVYTVPADQPTVAVEMWNCQNKPKLDQNLIAQWAAVPLPSDAVIPPDSDAHVAVWQPATDTVWEMWKTRTLDGRWQACWGGRLEHASTSEGIFPFPFGATASGFSLQAGLITLKDLAQGRIDHALAIGVDRTMATTFSWPANRTDGHDTGPGSIPMGQRLRLDPTVDLSSLHLTTFGRMIAEAMQRYGVVVRDTTVDAVSVYAEYPTGRRPGDPDPYAAYFDGKAKWAQLDPIPWSRMLALPLDYGKP